MTGHKGAPISTTFGITRLQDAFGAVAHAPGDAHQVAVGVVPEVALDLAAQGVVLGLDRPAADWHPLAPGR